MISDNTAKYKFESIERIAGLAVRHIQGYTNTIQKIKNGMPPAVYLDFLILDLFLRKNFRDDITLNIFDTAIEACAKHYQISPQKLQKSFRLYSGTDYLSQDEAYALSRAFQEVMDRV